MDEFVTGTGMAVDMLLCDSAQVAGGKLFILGGGVATIGPKPQPLALAIHISVPWDTAESDHTWKIELLDEDGRHATVRTKPFVLQGRFRPRRPPTLRPGTPVGVSVAINLAPLPLQGDTSYAFALSIDDSTRPQWRVRFHVRGAPPAA